MEDKYIVLTICKIGSHRIDKITKSKVNNLETTMSSDSRARFRILRHMSIVKTVVALLKILVKELIIPDKRAANIIPLTPANLTFYSCILKN